MGNIVDCCPFEGCCGITIFYSWYSDDHDEADYDDEMLLLTEAECDKALADIADRPRKGGLYLVALSQSQKDQCHPMFINRGWELVSKAYNNNSGNNIYLYSFTVAPVR